MLSKIRSSEGFTEVESSEKDLNTKHMCTVSPRYLARLFTVLRYTLRVTYDNDQH